MLLPNGCPAWQYNENANCREFLKAGHIGVLTRIQSGQYTVEGEACDTRQIHDRLFRLLSPPGYRYYAGNYRGHDKKCLRDYSVRIPGDPRVGVPPENVADRMAKLGEEIVIAVSELEREFASKAGALDPRHRTISVVRVACAAFVEFLTIHPYADGNGHSARALLWIILRRFGFAPKGWTIDPRPIFPDYSQMISLYRSGHAEKLEQFVLTCIHVAVPDIEASE